MLEDDPKTPSAEPDAPFDDPTDGVLLCPSGPLEGTKFVSRLFEGKVSVMVITPSGKLAGCVAWEIPGDPPPS